MKTALNENEQPVTAAESAPLEAWCPQCKHQVLLRKRRLMNGRGFAFYWRHQRGGNLNCPARSSYRNGK